MKFLHTSDIAFFTAIIAMLASFIDIFLGNWSAAVGWLVAAYYAFMRTVDAAPVIKQNIEPVRSQVKPTSNENEDHGILRRVADLEREVFGASREIQ